MGGPNAGKSRILAELTNAKPTVADYPFSTHEPMPGMMPWEDVFVQLIDTPPVTADHMEAYLPNIVRSADEVLLCMDGSSDDGPDQTADTIEQFKQRKTLLDTTTGFDEEQFSILHIKTLLAITRADDPDCADRLEYFREMVTTPYEAILVELDHPRCVEELRQRIYASMDVIRIYTKAPGKPADYTDPFTLPAGGTVEALAAKVHRELPEKLKFAKVWGEGFHDGQSVGLDAPLHDRNLVELHT